MLLQDQSQRKEERRKGQVCNATFATIRLPATSFLSVARYVYILFHCYFLYIIYYKSHNILMRVDVLLIHLFYLNSVSTFAAIIV